MECREHSLGACHPSLQRKDLCYFVSLRVASHNPQLHLPTCQNGMIVGIDFASAIIRPTPTAVHTYIDKYVSHNYNGNFEETRANGQYILGESTKFKLLLIIDLTKS